MGEVAPMRGRRQRRVVCRRHGHGLCELDGEPGPPGRADEKRLVRGEIAEALHASCDEERSVEAAVERARRLLGEEAGA